jgi:antitoxin VapB
MGATEKRQGLKSQVSGGMGDRCTNFRPWCRGQEPIIASRPKIVYTCVYFMEGAGMAIARTRTFKSGNSEAIRLPRDVAFGENVELVIVRSGDVMTIYPAATSIPEMVARLRSLPVPPDIEARDEEELPERPGL